MYIVAMVLFDLMCLPGYILSNGVRLWNFWPLKTNIGIQLNKKIVIQFKTKTLFCLLQGKDYKQSLFYFEL